MFKINKKNMPIFIFTLMICNYSHAKYVNIVKNYYLVDNLKNENKDNNDNKSTPEELSLRTGFSFGPHFGYQINNIHVDDADFINATNGKKSFDFNGAPLGFHIDYNFLINNGLFIGIGYDINHCFSNKSHNIEIDIPYFNRENRKLENSKAYTKLVFKKGLSQSITGRFGICNKIFALDINLSLVRSRFSQEFSVIYDKEGIRENYKKTFNRIGIAPGFGITFPIDKNFSVGFNYRYEIYPRKGECKTTADMKELENSRSKERTTTHNMAIKFSYHL